MAISAYIVATTFAFELGIFNLIFPKISHFVFVVAASVVSLRSSVLHWLIAEGANVILLY